MESWLCTRRGVFITRRTVCNQHDLSSCDAFYCRLYQWEWILLRVPVVNKEIGIEFTTLLAMETTNTIHQTPCGATWLQAAHTIRPFLGAVVSTTGTLGLYPVEHTIRFEQNWTIHPIELFKLITFGNRGNGGIHGRANDQIIRSDESTSEEYGVPLRPKNEL